MATTPSSGPGSGNHQYPKLAHRNWTDEEISQFLARVEEGKRLILAERDGKPLTPEELDDALLAVREGRD